MDDARRNIQPVFKTPGKKGMRQPLTPRPNYVEKSSRPQFGQCKTILSPAPSAKENVNPRTPRGLQKSDKDKISKLGEGHDVVMQVLCRRALHLRAANSLWHSQGHNSVVSFLLERNDPAITVDLLPHLIDRMTKEDESLSLGACLELLPSMEKLFQSKYEEHVVRAMDFMKAIIKCWWHEMRATATNTLKKDDPRISRSVPEVYAQLLGMAGKVQAMSRRPGVVGEKAQILDLYISQMCQ